LRVGLIGCGLQGVDVLCPPLAADESVELAACADVDEVRAKETAERFGFARPYLDYGDMLANESLDAVVVALPHAALKTAVIDALDAGVPVFVEKPAGLNQAEAEEIIAAEHLTGRRVTVGYCERYAEGRVIMKRLISAGAIGRIQTVSASKGSWPLEGWRADPDAGGGPLQWVGSHLTDQILWMTDAEPVRVYGEMNRAVETGVDDATAFTLRLSGDILASVVCSQRVGAVDVIEVAGDAGRIRAEWEWDSHHVPRDIVTIFSEVDAAYSHPTTIEPGKPSPLAMYERELEAWVASIKDDTDPPVTMHDASRVLSVLDAAVESARTGLPVEIS
jgi:UDP-N-acetylglucosamine 3-dehydrogenase